MFDNSRAQQYCTSRQKGVENPYSPAPIIRGASSETFDGLTVEVRNVVGSAFEEVRVTAKSEFELRRMMKESNDVASADNARVSSPR